ncbi:MAG: hypothetical protein ACYSW3_17450 [Planctomycetota bacterium]|jgi:hypothetical protein
MLKIFKGVRARSFSLDIYNHACENRVFRCVSPQLSGTKYYKSKNGGRKIMKCRLTAFGCLSFIICLLNVQTYGVNTSKKVKVFILAGQSNMEGKAKLSLLEYQIDQPETRDFFKHLKKDGQWVVRDDVWINYLDSTGRASSPSATALVTALVRSWSSATPLETILKNRCSS